MYPTKRISTILLLLLYNSCCLAQPKSQKSDLRNIYTQAIGDFIKKANQINQKSFDTLYFGKHRNGQETDFPDIQLPVSIEHTAIQLISVEEGRKSQKDQPSRIYINLIGWASDLKAEFIFVVFSNGFQHQYDYQLYYDYNPSLKKFELKNFLHIPLEVIKENKKYR